MLSQERDEGFSRSATADMILCLSAAESVALLFLRLGMSGVLRPFSFPLMPEAGDLVCLRFLQKAIAQRDT